MKKNSLYSILFCIISSLLACAQSADVRSEKHRYSNELIHETSPYLLQHAHNPVQWHAWNPKTLAKAKKENKMLLISIGYAACHWCHVMEHESFEDTSIARFMNEHFICVKIDREERPDVDQIYMTACQLINQSGGWPLNALALPDGRPFYAGTYFTKEQWLKILDYFNNLYQNEKSKLEDVASELTKGIASNGTVALQLTEQEYKAKDIEVLFESWSTSIDFQKGGFQKAPKFPLPGSWDFMMQYYQYSKKPKALEALTSCLDNMAMGGIYDHLAGGFARYSTDVQWKVPHFEKMLYDNAQLVALYAQAYQLTKNPLYKQVVFQTLDWLETEMYNKEGAFYSSLDADSEGEEGKFYIWTIREIEAVLKDDAALFIEYYNCTSAGNWEDKQNILLRKNNLDKIAAKYAMDSLDVMIKIDSLRSLMLQKRNKRTRPGLDDKILCAWNAMMLTGYIKAYRAFGQEKQLQKALKLAAFIQQHFIQKNHILLRNYKDGKTTINGLLDDYAFVISAFAELYQVTFDEQWLQQAKYLTNHCLEHFWDSTSQMFHYTPDYNEALIARKMELTDNVIPGSNSEMAHNLYRLGTYFDNKSYRSKAQQMLANVADKVKGNPTYFFNWAKLMLQYIRPAYEVAILGDDAVQIRKDLDQQYLPNVLLLGGKNEGSLNLLEHKLVEGQTTVYVCQQKTCQRPVQSAQQALKQMQQQ